MTTLVANNNSNNINSNVSASRRGATRLPLIPGIAGKYGKS